MSTAKIFKHGGSQAIRLPKEFRFAGDEVFILKRGDDVILRPKPAPKFKSLAEVARYMRDQFPAGAEFPNRSQPAEQQMRSPSL